MTQLISLKIFKKFENFFVVNSGQTKKETEDIKLVESEPAFVCLNETDPLYYVSTFKKLGK